MITKCCEVVDRGGFDRGQQGWAGLRELPGFLGQYGGWSRRRDGTEIAHIVAFWSDPDSYEQFEGWNIGGDFVDAHCQVRAHRVDHFTHAQTTV